MPFSSKYFFSFFLLFSHDSDLQMTTKLFVKAVAKDKVIIAVAVEKEIKLVLIK